MKLHVCVAPFVRLIKTVANETKSALMNSLPNNERALLVAAEKILLEVATNRSLGPSEVRVKMQAATICGSDISYFMKGRSGSFELQTPFVLGHEGSGIIIELGTAVESVGVGDQIAINPGNPCRHCYYCIRGRSNLCENMRYFGSASTDPPALAFSAQLAKNEVASVTYATVYPLTMILRIIAAQLLILFFS